MNSFASQKFLPKKSLRYPPEVIVLVTPNVSKETRATLHPALCTRIIEVEPLSFPENSIQNKQVVSSHVKSWGIQGSLTKLHIFRLDVYDTILYVDADCLVIKDVSHLFDLGKVYEESDTLIAASPDIFPPDKFNAGVMVIRPSKSVFENMMAQSSLLTTYDGGDTGYLNAYFPEWFTEMPPMARLPFGYNAQRFLFHCTYDKQPNYWDLAVSPDLYILHFSSSPKPWETKPPVVEHSPRAQTFLDEEEVKSLEKVAKTSELEHLWWKWYQRSKNYVIESVKERQEEEKCKKAALAAAHKLVAGATPKTAQEAHKLVTSRYRELRREGLAPKQAMEQARVGFGQSDIQEPSPSSQVGAMFGLSGIM